MKQKAFTLLEVLITLAIIMILVGALAGTGKYLRTRSETQLTASAIEIINTALEQYHEQYRAFPFKNRDETGDAVADPYTLTHFQLDTGMDITVGTLKEKDGGNQEIWNASSVALFYFLDRHSDSKAILETLSSRLITNVDAMTGQPVKMVMGGVTYDVPRFIDAWGMSLQYEYMSNYAFPKIMSAGPDKVFGTSDDLGK